MSLRVGAAPLVFVLLSSPAEVTRSPSPHASRGAPEGTQPYPGPAGHVKWCARANDDREIPLAVAVPVAVGLRFR